MKLVRKACLRNLCTEFGRKTCIRNFEEKLSYETWTKNLCTKLGYALEKLIQPDIKSISSPLPKYVQQLTVDQKICIHKNKKLLSLPQREVKMVESSKRDVITRIKNVYIQLVHAANAFERMMKNELNNSQKNLHICKNTLCIKRKGVFWHTSERLCIFFFISHTSCMNSKHSLELYIFLLFKR